MKKFINQLLGNVKAWVRTKLLMLKNWAMKAALTQLYVVVIAVLLGILIYSEQNHGNLCGILIVAMGGWWAVVKFGFVKYTQIDNDDLKE